MGLTSRWQVVMSDTAAFGTTDNLHRVPADAEGHEL
jgi:hypothetical protein